MPGVPVSVTLIYISTAILAACIIFGGGVLYLMYYRYHIAQTAPIVLPGPPGSPSFVPDGILALKESAEPRDSATVRNELIEALNRAEALKAELDTLTLSENQMTQMTGQSTGLYGTV